MTMKLQLNMPLFWSLIICLTIQSSESYTIQRHTFSFDEANVDDIQLAFKQGKLTSRQLVEFYLGQISRLNPLLRGVIEVNPDALYLADKADYERKTKALVSLSTLHGIPIVLKDNIATKDKMNTTAGSYALLGSVVPRDAGVVMKLRKAGAIILGKASLTEWARARSTFSPNGWCARSGQGKNPYNLSEDTCGSSSGSAISVTANMVALSLGTETQGSIICPSSFMSIVGIKPTVGLTSRDGIVPFTPRQDTVGPMCRTVKDAVYVLDAIVGFDHRDEATREASKYIPPGGYKQFLKPNGLKGKRLGLFLEGFFNESTTVQVWKRQIDTLSRRGAVMINNLEVGNIFESSILDSSKIAQSAELKVAINAYLRELITSPVRSLSDIIAFNEKYSKLEMTKEYGQNTFLAAAATNGIDNKVKAALSNLTRFLGRFENLMIKNKIDALVAPIYSATFIMGIGGYPGISVPAGFDTRGLPFGLCFAGLKGSEPKLIEISYAFEQATNIRKPPSFKR